MYSKYTIVLFLLLSFNTVAEVSQKRKSHLINELESQVDQLCLLQDSIPFWLSCYHETPSSDRTVIQSTVELTVSNEELKHSFKTCNYRQTLIGEVAPHLKSNSECAVIIEWAMANGVSDYRLRSVIDNFLVHSERIERKRVKPIVY